MPNETSLEFAKTATPEKIATVLDVMTAGWPPWPVYLKQYPDLKDVDNGYWHFLNYGCEEGRLLNTWRFPSGPTPEPPTPGGWTPPTTPGMHEIFKKPGGFGMGVARTATGLLAGTYRQGGQAKLYSFDGTLKEIMAHQIESFYMIVIPPDGLPVISTEVPAQILKMQPDGTFLATRLRSQPESCAFEILPHGDGLMVQTVDRAAGFHTQMFKGDKNGNNFQLWQDVPNKYLLNYGTDGSQVKMVGATEATENGLPLIVNPDGSDYHQRGEDSGYQDNQYSYVVGSGGRWSLGAQTITASREHRSAYVDIWDGSNLRSIQDFTRPWTMDMQITPDGVRWCVASSWQETDHPTSELWKSTDNGEHWGKVCEPPMPSVISMFFADGGVYLIGGTYGAEMKCLFYKF